jgi:hypothetical protein
MSTQDGDSFGNEHLPVVIGILFMAILYEHGHLPVVIEIPFTAILF